MINKICLVLSFFLFIFVGFGNGRPNVLLIMCDDLNDYIGAMGGHPQVKTLILMSFLRRQ